MNAEPVDVIIPYSPEHTPERLRARAVESVRSQTISAEPIVVTDEQQRGVAWARNRGLDRSSHRFVAFLDADDHWASKKLEVQMATLRESDTALCLTATERSDGSVTDVAASTATEFAAEVFLGSMASFTSSMVIDTKKTNVRFDETIYRLEDHLFALKAARDGGYCYVDSALTYVEKHEEGLSENENHEQKLEAQERFHEEAIRLFPVLEKLSNRFWARTYYHHGRHYYFDGEYLKSLDYLGRSFIEIPHLKPVGAFALSFVQYCWMSTSKCFRGFK
ncbi:glycosyltransferase family 2 protein [Natrialba sp. PRR66]|uniref:glycosyltransferase family 2 protein n=1 Tax=Natrialba sp. PRR66 TaxID=3098146 RepID=UPI002B1D2CEA|nr:glycosyltransferase family 2 protein [Natrialba sp. PRR66]